MANSIVVSGIDVTLIPDDELNSLCFTLLGECRSFYADPDNKNIIEELKQEVKNGI